MALDDNKRKKEFEKALKSIEKWNIPSSEKKRLKNYINDYRVGEVTGRVNLNPEANLERVIHSLKPFLINLNKDIKKLTVNDTKALSAALVLNEIKNAQGNEYKTKTRMFSILRTYLKYHDINNKVIKVLNKKVAQPRNSKRVISEDELENELCKIYASEPWQYFFYQVMFWGGLRRGELLGLEARDIKLPEKGVSNFVKIYIRREIAKNDDSERQVTLYGPNCALAVRNYMKKRREDGIKNSEILFEKSSEAVKSWLVRLSEKLNRPIHAHLFRHSCATLLARKIFKGDTIKICDHFGWTYNSPQPNRYIRRKNESRYDDEQDDIVSKSTLEDIDKKLEDLEQSKNVEIDELKLELEKMKPAIEFYEKVGKKLLKMKEKNPVVFTKFD